MTIKRPGQCVRAFVVVVGYLDGRSQYGLTSFNGGVLGGQQFGVRDSQADQLIEEAV